MHFGNPIADTPGVEFVQGDIRDQTLVWNSLRDVRQVVHLAGIVTDALVDMNPELGVKVNRDATQQLCSLARARFVSRFLYMSSSSVYGNSPDIATEMTSPKPVTVYAESKLAGEEACTKLASETFCVVIPRSATCCGPAPRMRLDTIVNVFSAQAWFDGVIRVDGGAQHRTNVHIEDLCTAIELMLDAPSAIVNAETFNVAEVSRTALEIATIVRDLARHWQRPCRIEFTGVEDDRHYRMSSLHLRTRLGWTPRFTTEDAVADNFRWFDAGNIPDWHDDLYYNTRRMASVVRS